MPVVVATEPFVVVLGVVATAPFVAVGLVLFVLVVVLVKKP